MLTRLWGGRNVRQSFKRIEPTAATGGELALPRLVTAAALSPCVRTSGGVLSDGRLRLENTQEGPNLRGLALDLMLEASIDV